MVLSSCMVVGAFVQGPGSKSILFAGMALVVCAPAACAQTGAARGQTEEFAPAALVRLVSSVCGARAGEDVAVAAKGRGMGAAQSPPSLLKRALPADARSWPAPSSDGELYLFGYGDKQTTCGAAVVHAIPGATFELAQAQLMKSGEGFAVESSQTMGNDVKWTRLRSASGQFVDMMEYPARNDQPPVMRIDFLPR